MLNKMLLDSVKPTSYSIDKVGDIVGGFLPEGVFSQQDLDYRIPQNWFVTKEQYNTFLQTDLFGDRNSRTPTSSWNINWYLPTPMGSLVYDIEHGHEQVSQFSSNTKLIVQPQIAGHTTVVGSPKKFNAASREPMNEEIEAQVGIAIAHGAESLFWFIYQSWECPYVNGLVECIPSYLQDNIYEADSVVYLGLLETNSAERRTINCYGQPKWEFVSSLNDKILKWKPVLENTSWLNGYSVHYDGANHYYIDGMLSVDPRLNYHNSCPNDAQLRLG
jgi:hypothetical protein